MLVMEYYQISANERASRRGQDFEYITFRTRMFEINPIPVRHKNMEYTFQFAPAGLIRICYILTQPRARVQDRSCTDRTLDFSGAGPGKQPIQQAVVKVDQYDLEVVNQESGCKFIYDVNKSVTKQERNGLVFVLLNPTVNINSFAPQGGFYAGLIEQIHVTLKFNKFPGGKPGEQNVCIYTETYELVLAYGNVVMKFSHGNGMESF